MNPIGNQIRNPEGNPIEIVQGKSTGIVSSISYWDSILEPKLGIQKGFQYGIQ